MEKKGFEKCLFHKEKSQKSSSCIENWTRDRQIMKPSDHGDILFCCISNMNKYSYLHKTHFKSLMKSNFISISIGWLIKCLPKYYRSWVVRKCIKMHSVKSLRVILERLSARGLFPKAFGREVVLSWQSQQAVGSRYAAICYCWLVILGVRRNTKYLTHCHFERSREVFY